MNLTYRHFPSQNPQVSVPFQAMTELWEEDEILRKALPWHALTLKAPVKDMRWGLSLEPLGEQEMKQEECGEAKRP